VREGATRAAALAAQAFLEIIDTVIAPVNADTLRLRAEVRGDFNRGWRQAGQHLVVGWHVRRKHSTAGGIFFRFGRPHRNKHVGECSSSTALRTVELDAR